VKSVSLVIFSITFVISCVLQVSAEPHVKHKVGPNYPPLAWQASIQGSVTVEIELGTDGDVVSAKASGAHEIAPACSRGEYPQLAFRM
jgi:hypothetical protein